MSDSFFDHVMGSSLSRVDASTIGVAVFASAALIIALRRKKASELPLPPGPPPRRLIGNLLDIPPANSSAWLKWSEWTQQYGDVVHLEALGQHIIILGSEQAVNDLLVKRGGTYSDRVTCTMANISGYRDSLILQSHNECLRTMKRLCAPIMDSRSVLNQCSLIEEAVLGFLRRVSQSTDGKLIREHLHWLNGGTILKMMYGYVIKDKNDPIVHNADVAVKDFSAAASPGWLVDLIPSLQHLPGWFPGTGFQRQAAIYAERARLMFDVPFEMFKQRMATDDYPADCLVAKAMAQNPDEEAQHVIKYAMGSMYSGGVDTTIHSEETFFLAMALHPEIQRRAQAEIDAFTEGHRLPTYADRMYLPFVDAIVKEVLRWNHVVPGGIPHMVRQEDEYRGWRIPAGSIIIGNIWHLMHDPKIYDDPLAFNPDRHLGPNPCPDPHNTVFGFGRRECPGKHWAKVGLFITIANTLATFNIRKARDAHGQEIVPQVEFTGGTISGPVAFPFEIVPRSEQALALIR